MSLLDKLERRFSRYAVPNISMLLIFSQVAVWLFDIIQSGNVQQPEAVVSILTLKGNQVLAGEVWRLFTFSVVPPVPGVEGFIPNAIGWYVFYFLGSVMEQSWGDFRFNLYLILGWLFTAAACFVEPSMLVMNEYYYSSVFLAFARLYPHFVFHLFFILPIEVRWLALLQWVLLLLALIANPAMWPVILAPVANYILFFWREHYRDLYHQRRRAVFQAKAAPKSNSGRIMHTCAVCGRNSADEPRTQFRYCSQCNGQLCYCPDHIRDHEHVAESADER